MYCILIDLCESVVKVPKLVMCNHSSHMKPIISLNCSLLNVKI